MATSDYRARTEQQIQMHVSNLISLVTGFDETDQENFQIAEDYIHSNIRNNKFLSVDKFKVTRELNGVQEKMMIHCQESKALRLKQQVEVFMKRKLKQHTPDIHYAILHFLLLMSNQPLDSDYEQVSNESLHGKLESHQLHLRNPKIGDQGRMLEDSFNSSAKNNNDNYEMFFGRNNNLNEKDNKQEHESDENSQSDDDEDEDDDESDWSQDGEEEEEQQQGLEIEDESKNVSTNNMFQNNNNNSKTNQHNISKPSFKSAQPNNRSNNNNPNNIPNILDNSTNSRNMNLNNVTTISQNITNNNCNTSNALDSNNPNNLSMFFGGFPTNQSFWNIAHQAQKYPQNTSTLHRRSYAEHLSEQQQTEEQSMLFRRQRQFSKNDLFSDANCLSTVYEQFISQQSAGTQEFAWVYQTRTERSVLNDVILMLQGQSNLTFTLVENADNVLECQNGSDGKQIQDQESPAPQFKLSRKIQLTHLTPGALENILDAFIEFANILQEFTHFHSFYQRMEINTTFQAFLHAIQKYFSDIALFLNDFQLVFLHQSGQMQRKELECSISKQHHEQIDKRASLMELFKGIREHMPLAKSMMNALKSVIEIFSRNQNNKQNKTKEDAMQVEGIGQDDNSSCNTSFSGIISSKLIDWSYAQLQSNYGQLKSKEIQSACESIFLASISPYLTILNDWLHGGFFYDRYSEFFIQNNHQSYSKNSKQMQCYQEEQNAHTIQKYQHIDHKIIWNADYSLRLDETGNPVTPVFLKKYQNTILELGKAVRLVGYIAHEHHHHYQSSSSKVVEHLKLCDLKQELSACINEALNKIQFAQSDVKLKDNLNKLETKNETISQHSTNPFDLSNSMPSTSISKLNLNNLSISKILQERNKNKLISNPSKNCLGICTSSQSIHNKSLVIDTPESAMVIEKKDNPFGVQDLEASLLSHSSSVFSLQDSFLKVVIPQLQQEKNAKLMTEELQGSSEEKSIQQDNTNVKNGDKILKEKSISCTQSSASFPLVFDLSFSKVLLELDNKVQRHLSGILFEDFKLLEYFEAFRVIYFYEDGQLQAEFLNYVFGNLETYNTLQNPSSLKSHFKELLHNSRHPFLRKLTDNITVEISQDKINNTQLKDLKIVFTAPYPLDVIFDQDSLFLYNTIYMFLLQIKKSGHFLAEKNYYLKKTRKRHLFSKVHSGDMEEENSNSSGIEEDNGVDRYERSILERRIDKCLRQLCLLQRELLHASQALSYQSFETVLRVNTGNFLNLIKQEYRISKFIEAHKAYLKSIADLCFLSKNNEHIFSIISNLLNLCCNFHAIVCRLEAIETLDINTIRSELQRIEEDTLNLKTMIGRHVTFIIKFLINFEMSGLKPEWMPLCQQLDFNKYYIKEENVEEKLA